MKKNFKLINRKNLYNGFFQLNQFTFKHKKHNNLWSSPITREIFSGGHSVTVLPYDPNLKKIVLVEQFRSGLIEKKHNPIMKEIIAGVIDKGEKPKEAAIRECKEETGCKVEKLIKILSYYPTPGYSQSYYHFFLAEVKSFKGNRILGQQYENEDILARCYSIKDVRKMLNNGKIINGITLIALQWFFLNYKLNI